MRTCGEFSHRDRGNRKLGRQARRVDVIEIDDRRGVEDAASGGLVRDAVSGLVGDLGEVGPEPAGVDLRRLGERRRNRRRAHEPRTAQGVNAPTGVPLRVTMNVSPASRRRMISPLSLHNSRWLIVVATTLIVAPRATEHASRHPRIDQEHCGHLPCRAQYPSRRSPPRSASASSRLRRRHPPRRRRAARRSSSAVHVAGARRGADPGVGVVTYPRGHTSATFDLVDSRASATGSSCRWASPRIVEGC